VGRAHKKNTPDIDLGPHNGAKAGVSRRHARFVLENDSWFLEDLGSTNGTYLNGGRIAPNQKMPVKKGDKVRFGQIELEFNLEE
jgi:pSer/pThr/pTyr-binding forkhead associated (FHA) protein